MFSPNWCQKGRTVAIIATARKIAVIIYKMLESGQAYSYEYAKDELEKVRKIQIKKTQRIIQHFNIQSFELQLTA